MALYLLWLQAPLTTALLTMAGGEAPELEWLYLLWLSLLWLTYGGSTYGGSTYGGSTYHDSTSRLLTMVLPWLYLP